MFVGLETHEYSFAMNSIRKHNWSNPKLDELMKPISIVEF